MRAAGPSVRPVVCSALARKSRQVLSPGGAFCEGSDSRSGAQAASEQEHDKDEEQNTTDSESARAIATAAVEHAAAAEEQDQDFMAKILHQQCLLLRSTVCAHLSS